MHAVCIVIYTQEATKPLLAIALNISIAHGSPSNVSTNCNVHTSLTVNQLLAFLVSHWLMFVIYDAQYKCINALQSGRECGRPAIPRRPQRNGPNDIHRLQGVARHTTAAGTPCLKRDQSALHQLSSENLTRIACKSHSSKLYDRAWTLPKTLQNMTLVTRR